MRLLVVTGVEGCLTLEPRSAGRPLVSLRFTPVGLEASVASQGVLSLPWCDDAPPHTTEAWVADHRWSLVVWPRAKTSGGIAVLAMGDYADSAGPLWSATTSWMRRRDVGKSPTRVLLPVAVPTTAFGSFSKLRATVTALCDVVAALPELRRGLGEPDRMAVMARCPPPPPTAGV